MGKYPEHAGDDSDRIEPGQAEPTEGERGRDRHQRCEPPEISENHDASARQPIDEGAGREPNHQKREPWRGNEESRLGW